MPWPMVHLAVAAVIMPEPSAELLIGSLAPDAVHVRGNDRGEKAKTHLMIVEGEFLTDEQLHAVFKANTERIEADPAFLHYLLGYIAHIYTDRRWTFEIYPGYEAHSDGRKQYHREVKRIEFMLLQDKPTAHEWLRQLKTDSAFEFGGLSAEEVHTYRDMKLLGLQEESADESKVPLEVLSPERLEQFILANGQDLRRLFAEWGITPSIRQNAETIHGKRRRRPMDSSNEADTEEPAFLKIDKAYTPFLLKAIEAVKRTNWVESYDMNRVHISMRKDRYQGRECIVVRFYAAELTNANWMEVTPADIGGAHVYMEAAGRAVLHIAIEH